MNQSLIEGNQIYNIYKGISSSAIRELDLNKEDSINVTNNDRTCVKQYISLNNNPYEKKDGRFQTIKDSTFENQYITLDNGIDERTSSLCFHGNHNHDPIVLSIHNYVSTICTHNEDLLKWLKNNKYKGFNEDLLRRLKNNKYKQLNNKIVIGILPFYYNSLLTSKRIFTFSCPHVHEWGAFIIYDKYIQILSSLTKTRKLN